MVGLGRMGLGMSERLLDAGHAIVGYDPQETAREHLVEAGGNAVATLESLAAALEPARLVWVMVPAGDVVDATLERLGRLLSAGDTVVDGGNSNYRRTIERGAALAERGIDLVDAGTSGGIWGRREGYCLMVGGEAAAVERLRPALAALAPAADRGWAHVGPRGSGHFVKMVHNGIEYGLMQAYAEGFAILERKRDLDLDLAQVAEVWRHGSVVRSWLLDLIAGALAEDAGLAEIEPWVADSGEGRWTVQEAIDLDAPAPVITLALIERLSSRERDSFAHRLLAAMRREFGGHAVKPKA
jgi:6-phosphogluconate dehydrogenase